MDNGLDVLGLVVGTGVFVAIFLLIVLVGGLGNYLMARKAGVRTAWLSFIPFLNWIPYFGMLNKSAWNILWLFVPVVNIILMIIWTVELFSVFDRNPAMILLWLLVPGFSFVYPFYLGLSRNVEYVG